MDRIVTEEQAQQARVKRELIDAISQINLSARPKFLNQFSAAQLQEYLDHLTEVEQENDRNRSLAS